MEPFIQESERYLKLLQWEKQCSSLVVGFTTRNGGVSRFPFQSLNMGFHVDDNQDSVRQNRQLLADDLSFPLTNWIGSEQVHDSKIVRVSAKEKGMGANDLESAIRKTDGLYTNEPNLLLTSLYADCVPIYYFAPAANLIGLAHAGWRGTVSRITTNMIHLWVEKEGVQKKDILVAIGPCISAERYEVNHVVIEAVNSCFAESFDTSLLYKQSSEEHYLLDLRMVNNYLLLQAGIDSSQIVISSLCTAEVDRFFSHRAEEGKTGRLMSFIGMRKDGR